MSDLQTHARPRWLRVLPGAALVLVPVVVAATTWSTLVANHPAYPAALLVSLLLGLWLVFSGLRPTVDARTGAVRTTFRVLAALLGLGLAAALWWLTPFVADAAALDALVSDDAVTVNDSRTVTTYEPAQASGAAFVLYPGARVDPRAYAVLARGVAEQGHPVTVLKCPLDIGFTCVGAAAPYVDGPTAVGGHSLGGVAASQFVTPDSGAEGLIFWASYPLGDLSDRDDLAVASISGSQDGLSTPADIEASAASLPPDTVFTEVDGAVHAFFGDYGEQPGDGTPTVDRAEAQAQIVAATVAALDRVSAAQQ
jgi:hypothetical protein